MKGRGFAKKDKASNKRKLKTTWKVIISVLCVAVFGCTAYLLAQPGITWNEKEEIALKASSCPVCGGKLDGALEWTPSTKGNPFGGAINYGLFMFGDLTDWNDTESNVALSGNLVKRNMGITYPAGAAGTATGIIMPKYEVGLILGGTLTQGLENKGVNVQNGSIIASKNISSLSSNGKLSAPYGHVHLTEQSKIDAFFEQAKKDAIARNQAMYNLPVNTTVTVDSTSQNTIIVKGTDKTLNVVKLTASQYSMGRYNYRNVKLDVPAGSTVIFNIDGQKEITDFGPTIMTKYDKDPWGKYDYQAPANKTVAPIGQKQTQRILFNFNPIVEKITLNKGFYLYGSVFAPNMEWNVSGAVSANGAKVYVGVNGIAVLKSANGNGTSSEFHYNPFVPFEAAEDQTTSISVVKKWTDESGRPSNAPANTSINVQLYRTTNSSTLSPNKAVGSIVELSVRNNWTYTWTNLEKIDPQGRNYYYYVREVGAVVNGAQQGSLAGYEVNYQNGAVASGSFTVTNKKVVNTDVTVNKIWLDSNGKPQNPSNGTTAQVTLYSYSQYTGKQKVAQDKNGRAIQNPVVVDKKSGWTYTWKNLAEKDSYGYKYEYSVEETPVDGYIPKYKSSGNNFTIENNEIAKYTVRGKKVWKNPDGSIMSNTDNLPQVKVQLYKLVSDRFYTDSDYIIKNGKPYGEAAWLSAKNNWVYDWKDIPDQELVNGQVKKCSYAAKEVSTVPGYTAKLEEIKKDEANLMVDATLVNTKKEVPSSSISVSKQWQNNTGDPIDPPEGAEIEIQLYQQLVSKPKTDESVKVNFKFPGINETYVVKKGTTFKYTVTFYSLQKYNGYTNNYPIFKTKPQNSTYRVTGTQMIRHPDPAERTYFYKKAQVTGSVAVSADTNIVFEEKYSSSVVNNDAHGDAFGQNYFPKIAPDYQKPAGSEPEKVVFTQKYGAPIKLSANRKWRYEWSKLPLEAEKNGVTYKCRYYVVETKPYEGYEPSYVINGVKYDKLGPNVNVIPEGIAEGELFIVNKNTVIPGIILPETGSSGTLLLMIFGTALMTVPIVYYVFRTKNERRARRKK